MPELWKLLPRCGCLNWVFAPRQIIAMIALAKKERALHRETELAGSSILTGVLISLTTPAWANDLANAIVRASRLDIRPIQERGEIVYELPVGFSRTAPNRRAWLFYWLSTNFGT